MVFGRSGAWQNEADGERGGNEQSGRHRVIELRIGVVSAASFSAKDVARAEGKTPAHDPCGTPPANR
jgi:hypothetical protein